METYTTRWHRGYNQPNEYEMKQLLNLKHVKYITHDKEGRIVSITWYDKASYIRAKEDLEKIFNDVLGS